MCGSCGCSENNHHESQHLASHDLAHHHSQEPQQTVQIEQDILSKNEEFAVMNRNYFTAKQILTLNIMSSPGAGKTTLLVKTIANLKQSLPFFVIVGDQQTERDAQRISATGISALQINTGKGCHLDAHDIGHALEKLTIPQQAILLIENVGNLVCPALFDLGEKYKIVMLSVTEGDDKPLKYPHMFYAADLVLLTKIDLLPYVDFDLEKCITYIKQINSNAEISTISTTTGENFNHWQAWLRAQWCSENKSTLTDVSKV
jgi:hydrogenase nickel incorporation protein HypB